VERRRKPVSRSTDRRIEPLPAFPSESVSLPLLRVEELIEFGQITVGDMNPIGGVAVASDGSNVLAMLVRREGETLAQLLTRLDQAIAKALDEGIRTDEINSRI